MIYGEPNIILSDVSNAYDDSKIPVILLDRTFRPYITTGRQPLFTSIL